MKQLKNKSRLCILAAIGAVISAPIYATAPVLVNNNQDGSGGVVQAIEKLAAQVKALAMAGADTVSDAVYQFDQNLPGIVQANTANSKLMASVETAATAQTLSEIHDHLSEFPQQLVPPKPDNDSNPDTKLQQMTVDIPASDTLYLPSQRVQVFMPSRRPPPSRDDYFSIDSIIGPVAYTSDQVLAAQSYIKFITQAYMPMGSSIDFKQLSGMSPKGFENFQRISIVYQTYQASVRSYMALSSISLSNFNSLIAERTVQTGLGASAGLTAPSSDGSLQPVADASPLQVENFVANRRISSVPWYQSMAAASPATVQRETLFVLAEIESQLQQLHMDNERALVSLSALNISNALSIKTTVQTQEQSVNSAIKVAVQSDAASSNASSADTNTNNIDTSNVNEADINNAKAADINKASVDKYKTNTQSP